MNAYRQHAYYPSYTSQQAYPHQQQQQTYPQNQWTQQVHQKAQPVFERLESIIRTCNSVSRCLDTALMSSHSGLTGLFRVLHQFQSMKQSLGQIFGLFSLVRYFKSNKKPLAFSVREFESFSHQHHRYIYWIIGLLIPFVIHYISLLAKKDTPNHTVSKVPTLTTKKNLDFARARHAFEAQNIRELSLQCNELIAVLSRDDNDWWYGRLKNGKMGYFPANHVELIKKN